MPAALVLRYTVSLDNSCPGIFPNIKTPLEVDPPRANSSRGSIGKPMSTRNGDNPSSPADSRRSHPVMASFVLRPFPPPSLADVPVEYIIDQLHNLAPHYWNKPETADCTIIVPVPQPQSRSMRTPETPPFLPEPLPSGTPSRHEPSTLGRRVTEPNLRGSPRITLKLHMDYLSSQSTFLRGLFSGASPLDLISTTVPTGAPSTCHHSSRPSGPFHVPPSRLPRLLPSSPTHPVVFLPVPDPTSFHLLVHWMYFGRTNYIEDALCQGIVQWEGLARNVEYLGLATEIKVFLGRWYGVWLHPGRSRNSCLSGLEDDSDYDEEQDNSEGEEVDGDDASSTVSQPQEDDSEEIPRGRTRTVRNVRSSASLRRLR